MEWAKYGPFRVMKWNLPPFGLDAWAGSMANKSLKLSFQTKKNKYLR